MKSILFIDSNLGLDHAVRLAEDYKVYYSPGGSGAYPFLQDHISGDGFPLTYVEDFGSVLYEVDMVFIVDCFLGGLADSLRKKGVSVFGPSAEWTRIENDRVYGWEALKKMGIGVPDGEVVTGMKGVLDFMEAHEDKTEKDPFKKRRFFLKVSRDRGNFPTKDVATVLEAQTALTQANFGPYLDDLFFLINFMSPGIEVGFDAFFNGREFIRPFAYTIEIKGSGTTAHWVDTNGIETEFFKKMQKSLADSGYRGNISMEFLWDGKRVYAIDPTARLPFACSTIQAHDIENYGEVAWKVAHGEDVAVEISGNYGYGNEITIATDDDRSYRTIRFPEQYKGNVGFRRCAFREGEYWFIPGGQIEAVVATALGRGDTSQQCIEASIKVAEEIRCNSIYFDGDYAAHMARIVEQLNSLGTAFAFDGSPAVPAKSPSDLLNFGPRHQRSRRFNVQGSRFKVQERGGF